MTLVTIVLSYLGNSNLALSSRYCLYQNLSKIPKNCAIYCFSVLRFDPNLRNVPLGFKKNWIMWLGAIRSTNISLSETHFLLQMSSCLLPVILPPPPLAWPCWIFLGWNQCKFLSLHKLSIFIASFFSLFFCTANFSHTQSCIITKNLCIYPHISILCSLY